MSLNGEPTKKWLVDINPHLNDVLQRVPSENSSQLDPKLMAQVGVDPKLMGIGPAFAIPPALEKAGERRRVEGPA